MADSDRPTLTGLSDRIAELSGTLNKYLQDKNIPPVSFAADSPTRYAELSPEMFMVRQQLLDALNDMWYLAQGPSESMFNYVHTVGAACLQSHAGAVIDAEPLFRPSRTPPASTP